MVVEVEGKSLSVLLHSGCYYCWNKIVGRFASLFPLLTASPKHINQTQGSPTSPYYYHYYYYCEACEAAIKLFIVPLHDIHTHTQLWLPSMIIVKARGVFSASLPGKARWCSGRRLPLRPAAVD